MKLEPKFRKGQDTPCGIVVSLDNEDDVHLFSMILRFVRNASPEESPEIYKKFVKMQMRLSGAVEALDGDADIFLAGDEVTRDYHESRKKFDPGYEVPS